MPLLAASQGETPRRDLRLGREEFGLYVVNAGRDRGASPHRPTNSRRSYGGACAQSELVPHDIEKGDCPGNLSHRNYGNM